MQWGTLPLSHYYGHISYIFLIANKFFTFLSPVYHSIFPFNIALASASKLLFGRIPFTSGKAEGRLSDRAITSHILVGYLSKQLLYFPICKSKLAKYS